jgi:protein SCO1
VRAGFRRLAVLLPALLLAAGPAGAAPPDTAGLGFEQRPGQQLPLDAAVRESDGRSSTLGQALGRGMPAVLALGYYDCPSLCGMVRDDMLSALDTAGLKAGQDYDLVFLSIDPHETPAQAAAAKAQDLGRYPTPGADRSWHYLTAPPDAIGRIEQAAGYHSRFDAKLKQFLHPAGLVVVSPDGRVSSYLLGIGYQPGAIRVALRQAAAGTIGQLASPVLLLCFHYDPTTGRYSLAILKLLQIAGILTVLSIGALLLLLRRKARPIG